MSKQINTFCRICEPACPLTAKVDDTGDVTSLEPNLDHPSKGVACHKGLSYIDLHKDPDRLNYPLRRKNANTDGLADFERISWDDAITECADKLKAIRDEHGPNSIAIFSGNPGVFNARGLTYGGAFSQMIGTKMMFSANTQDMSNRMLAASAFYGSQTLMIPDLFHTDYLLCIGSNPRVSKWTVISTANDAGKTIENIKKRGGKIRFINPRKTESSTPETGDTLRIKPGTDVYFLAAVLHEIKQQDGLDHDIIQKWSTGIDDALAFVSQYAADKVTDITGITVDEIKTVAAEFIAAKGAGIYVSTGLNQGRQGTLAAWLAEVIVFVTGNLGRQGGMIKPTGFMDRYQPSVVDGISVETSLGELSYSMPGTIPLPTVALPELIANGDIKALIVLGGNPLLSAGGASKLREAVGNLELMIAMDIQHNTTAEISDYALPCTDFLERADVNFIAGGTQTVPYIQYTDAVVEPKFERRPEWRIYLDIAKKMGLFPGNDPDGWGIVNKILGASKLSIDQLKDLPHQTHFFEPTPSDDVYQKVLNHPDKKVHCYPEIFEQKGLFERCEQIFNELKNEPANTLKMVSMRTTYMHNTWLSNVKKFRRGAQSTNSLHMCSQDADRLKLIDGQAIRVFNEYGSIETQLCVDDSMREGAVAMPHGYGKGRPGMRVAESNPGANPNQLAPNTMDTVEPLSNMSWIGAYPVKVESVGLPN